MAFKQIKTKQLNNPPIQDRYADDATMFADQANQRSGYVYLADESYYEYLGTTVGDITDYNPIGGSGGGSIISITHQDLRTLRLAGELSAGQLYRVTNFATVHRLQLPDTIITGVTENILVLATSATTLSKNCRSYEYPQDILEIDWTSNFAEDGTTPRGGWITFRNDTVANVSTYFDYRNVKVRRWAFNGFDWETGFVQTSPGNITLTLTWSANMTSTYLTVYRKWEVKFPSAFTHAAGAVNLTITKGAFSHTRPLLRKTTLLSDWAANELASNPGPIIYSPLLNAYILMDILEPGTAFVGYNIARHNAAYTVGNGLRILPGATPADYLTFQGSVSNTHLEAGCVNNFFVGSTYNFRLGGYSSHNTFVGNIATSELLGESNYNLFLGQLNWSNIGGEFASNMISGNANYFELYKFCTNNSIATGFNFEASQSYINSSTIYAPGWFYKFTSPEISGSFIGVTGSTRSDFSLHNEIYSSIIGYFNADNISIKKSLNAQYIHVRPAVTDLFASLNISTLPVAVGAVTLLGRDTEGNVVDGTGGGGGGGSVGAGAGLSIDGGGDIQFGKEEPDDTSLKYVDLKEYVSFSEFIISSDYQSWWDSGINPYSVIQIGESVLVIQAYDPTDFYLSTITSIASPTNSRTQLDAGNPSGTLSLILDTDNGISIGDNLNSKGAVYSADYSAVGILDDRWIPDYGAVKAYADSVGGGGGSSNWTVLGSDIYRDSRVLIGASSFTPSDTIAKLEVRGRLSVISGSNDIFIGRLAGPDSPPASNNSIAIGTLALRSLVNGNGNIGIGVIAGQNITSGGSNVGVGDSALSMVSVNSFNVGVGVISLTSTTGSNNTAIGHNSGGSLTSGSNNIFIGYNAGANLNGGSSNISAISQSIYIGSSTTSKAAAQVNEIVIGYDTDGEGSNTVVLGNTSIVKTFLRGTINMANLPTSSAGLITGDIWNDSGTLKIV